MKYTRKEGEIYFAVGSNCNYLFRSNSTTGYTHYIVIDKDGTHPNFIKYNSGPSFDWDAHFDVRDATELERQWFKLCLNANKLMPKPEFKENNYEIY